MIYEVRAIVQGNNILYSKTYEWRVVKVTSEFVGFSYV